jgi:hypothetical protein
MTHYYADGIINLACKIISQSMAEARLGSTEQLDVAFEWLVICGMEPHDAARYLVLAVQTKPEKPTPQELALRKQRARRRGNRASRYSQNRTCPACGCAITDRANTCKRHRNALQSFKTALDNSTET